MNIYAKILICLMVIEIIGQPAFFGKDKGKYSFGGWIGSIITLVLIIKALGIV